MALQFFGRVKLRSSATDERCHSSSCPSRVFENNPLDGRLATRQCLQHERRVFQQLPVPMMIRWVATCPSTSKSSCSGGIRPGEQLLDFGQSLPFSLAVRLSASSNVSTMRKTRYARRRPCGSVPAGGESPGQEFGSCCRAIVEQWASFQIGFQDPQTIIRGMTMCSPAGTVNPGTPGAGV